MKARLVHAPTLALANFSLPFILEVDASHLGPGTVLSQEQDGKVHPVEYASRSLSPVEKNYSSMKLEFLAMKWATMEKFWEYLWGQQWVVWINNTPLSHLETANLGTTEHRWIVELSAYNYTIWYCYGRSNQNADSLSRQSHEGPDARRTTAAGTAISFLVQQVTRRDENFLVTQAAISVFPFRTPAEVRILQDVDPTISALLSFLREQKLSRAEVREALPECTKVLLRQWDRIEVGDLLYHRIHRPDGGEEICQLLLPECLKDMVLQQLHNDHGHQRIEQITELVRQRCYWPRMGEESKQWCRQCQLCTVAKISQSKLHAPMGHLLASHTNQILAVDFTLLEPSRDGKEHVLIMIDVFSKFTQAVPI